MGICSLCLKQIKTKVGSRTFKYRVRTPIESELGKSTNVHSASVGLEKVLSVLKRFMFLQLKLAAVQRTMDINNDSDQ